MIYYSILIIIVVALSPLANGKKGNLLYLTIVFFLLTLYSAGRDFSVGTDTEQFVNSYKFFSDKQFTSVNFSQIYEPGFLIYMIFLSKISPEPRFFLIITYIIINFSIVKLIYNHSKDCYISVLIYILSCQFLASMCMLRQFLAISIILLGTNYLFRKQYYKYSIFVLIGMMFHYFSILFFILIPMHYKKKLTTTQNRTILLTFLGAFILLPQIMLYVITNFTVYSDYLIYLENVGKLNGTLRFPSMLLVLLIIFFPVILNFKKIYNKNSFMVYKRKDYTFINLLFMFLFLLVVLSSRFDLFTRVYYYFTPFLVLVPNIICKKKMHTSLKAYYLTSMVILFFTCLFLKKGTYGTESFIFCF